MKRFLCLALVSLSALAAPSAREFEQMKKEYLATLRLTDPAVAARIPAFELKLLGRAQTFLGETGRDSLRSKYLLYTAMYFANADIGMREGYLRADRLSHENRMTASTATDDVLIARTHKRLELLEAAKAADPADIRIPRWLSLTKVGLYGLLRQPLPADVLAEVRGLVTNNRFGLYNAYIAGFQLKHECSELEDQFEVGFKRVFARSMPCVEGVDAGR